MVNTKNPLVSVIIPTHNSEPFINIAINSVLKQTYENWELIIVNDASTDQTQNVVTEFVKKDKRIKLENLKTNVGGSGARNVGIKIAKGDYITFLDGDDEFLPEKIEEFVKFAQEDNNSSCVMVSDYFEEERKHLKKVTIPNVRNPIFALLTMEWHVASGSNLFIAKDLLKIVGLYNASYPRHQDIEFLIRCLQKADVKILHKPLVIIHGHNMEMGPKVTNNTLKIQKIIDAKGMLFSDFKDEIFKLSKKEQKRIYGKNWLQVARLYALDANWSLTWKYLAMSLKNGVMFSNSIPFLPYITYFVIPVYLLRSSFLRLIKR